MLKSKSGGYSATRLSAVLTRLPDSVVARNNDILKKLVLEAKREYEKDAVHRVHIYMADTYGGFSIPSMCTADT